MENHGETNSNIEYRNTKQYQNSNFQMIKNKKGLWGREL